MAEQYRFFGSTAGDTRQYNQIEFAEVFKRIFRNGYFPGVGNNLVVTANDPATMSVLVTTGEAWIEGYWYRNDSNKVLTINAADSVLNRIDRVVLRLDAVNSRTISAMVKQGTTASNPSPPALTRTAQTYEISLAQIYVNAGITSISQALIFDERENTNVCGQALSYYVGQECIKDLNVNNKKIVNVASPTGNNDAANKKYVDDGLNTKVNTTDVSTTAAANKLLKLNAQSKLPASITGDAQSVGGKTLSDMEGMYAHAQKIYGSVTYNEPFNAYETKTKYINLPNNKYKNGMLTYASMIAFFGTDYTKTKCVGAYYGWNGTFPSAWNGFVSRRYDDTGAYGSRNWIGIEQFVIEGDKIKVVLKNSDDESHTESLTINWEVW